MIDRSDNTAGPLTEEQIVDWIDGNVSADEASRLARASGRPDLAARVAQMQRQKSVLASLDNERAPAELYDRVMAAVERDVLLGIAQSASPSIVEPRLRLAGETESVGSRASRVVQGNLPRLALAAGLMLMVAGLAYFGSVAWKAVKTPVAPNIVDNGSGVPNGTEVAINDTTPGNGERAMTNVPGEAAAAKSAASSETALAAAAPDTGLREVSIERAVELAEEGRLAIRVLAQKPENLTRIERDVSKPRAERQWRMTSTVPAQIVAAVVPARKSTEGPVLASDHRNALALLGPYLGPGAALSMVTAAADPLARVKGTFLVDVPATREQLGVVAAVFKNQLSARVVFEELPTVLDMPTAPQAQDVLWWTQPPSQWVTRATVPVVVEQR